MSKGFFMNDYGEGAHPLVMQRLMETNLEHTCGYGMDDYSLRAQALIREKCGQPQAQVHMMAGGTSANVVALSAFMRPYEAVIAAAGGHINVHETGAVEASGHKVLVAASKDGKVLPEGVRAVCAAHPDEHMVHPRVLYISQSTEVGTVYTMDELRALRAVCDECGLILYVDGARLGSALVACGMTLAGLASVADCFYIGGTKNGLLFGEAMVIVNDALKPGFRRAMKRNGAMLAKGRLLGVQFAAAMAHDLWLDMGRHADAQAQRIAAALTDRNVPMYVPSPTNQIFPILSDAQIARLQEQVAFNTTARVDAAHQAVRFVTSWATTDAQVDALLAVLAQVLD